MLVPKVLLSVPHQPQQGDGDCLAACAAMVLAYLGREISYSRLLRLLKIQPHGAPSGNIRLLAALKFNVTYSQTDLTRLKVMIQQGHPVIVFVRTSELPYWTYACD